MPAGELSPPLGITTGVNAFADDLFMQAVAVRARTELGSLPPGMAAAGSHLLARLSPPQWTLEWYLPKWLGDAYGLPTAVTTELTLANVYGLLYIALQDKLADDGLAPEQQVELVCLGAALHHRWLRQYTGLFPGDSPFWPAFDSYMEQWWRATAAGKHAPPGDFAALLRDDPAYLAHRAAPLKLCCAAACLLAGRAALLPRLEEALDSFHTGAVLLDHWYDWREDLDAGRYNAFVHYAAALPQTPADRERNRQRVMEERLNGGVYGYFAATVGFVRAARRPAHEAACPPLDDYLRWYEELVITTGDEQAAAAHRLLEKATLMLFGAVSSETV